MTTEPTTDQDYYLEIEAHFAVRRNTPFILSAQDWALMQEWRAAAIPLPIVIEALDQVFERNEASGRKKTISSLRYCRHAVKELWEERKDLHVGGHSETPEAGPESMLLALADQLASIESSDAARAIATKAAIEIRTMATEKSVPKIEERLIALEHELIEELIASLPPDEVASLAAEIAGTLGDVSRLDEKTRKRTEEANLRRLVRQRFGLPRLTLFG